MMKYRNLTTIGTSHISIQSMREVEKTAGEIKPDIIALELDRKRLYALMHDEKRRLRLKDIMRIGIKGFVFNMIGAWVERKLGNLVGVRPGSEMMTALRLAKKYKAKIALVDQDIEITLARFSKAITWKEKFRFAADILKGLFFGKRELKKIGLKPIDLTKVPSRAAINKMVMYVRKRYPSVHRVLIEERNRIIANNLSMLMKHHPDKNILAIMGAGHEEDVIALVKMNISKIYK